MGNCFVKYELYFIIQFKVIFLYYKNCMNFYVKGKYYINYSYNGIC